MRSQMAVVFKIKAEAMMVQMKEKEKFRTEIMVKRYVSDLL